MSRRGVIAIDRGLFDHERFAPEPFTEREAWMWMIGQAAFRPYCWQLGSTRVELKRGQLACSLRFMAEKWKWAEPRVRRFLGKLRSGDALIDARSDAGITVITVCKYDAYQRLVPGTDAPDDALIDAKKNLQQEDRRPGGDARARATAEFQITEAAHGFAMELAAICKQDPDFLTPQWINAQPALRAQMWLNAGWSTQVMRELARAAVARKRDGPPSSVLYFEKIFARAHAPQQPLPFVETSEPATHENARPSLRIVRTAERGGDGFSTLAARLRAKGAGGPF